MHNADIQNLLNISNIQNVRLNGHTIPSQNRNNCIKQQNSGKKDIILRRIEILPKSNVTYNSQGNNIFKNVYITSQFLPIADPQPINIVDIQSSTSKCIIKNESVPSSTAIPVDINGLSSHAEIQTKTAYVNSVNPVNNTPPPPHNSVNVNTVDKKLQKKLLKNGLILNTNYEKPNKRKPTTNQTQRKRRNKKVNNKLAPTNEISPFLKAHTNSSFINESFDSTVILSSNSKPFKNVLPLSCSSLNSKETILSQLCTSSSSKLFKTILPQSYLSSNVNKAILPQRNIKHCTQTYIQPKIEPFIEPVETEVFAKSNILLPCSTASIRSVKIKNEVIDSNADIQENETDNNKHGVFGRNKQEKFKSKIKNDTNKAPCSTKIFLRGKHNKIKMPRRNKWQMDNGTRHEALQRIETETRELDKYYNDLFPLGIEGSDSEIDLEDEETEIYQKDWFHSLTMVEYDHMDRSARLNHLNNELRRQISQIKHAKKLYPNISKTYVKSIINGARQFPHETASLLCPTLDKKKLNRNVTVVTKQNCQQRNCKNFALPCSDYCTLHILKCNKQVLLEQCCILESDGVQCTKPVLNIKHPHPICSIHAHPNYILPYFQPAHKNHLYAANETKKIVEVIHPKNSVNKVKKETKRKSETRVRKRNAQPNSIKNLTENIDFGKMLPANNVASLPKDITEYIINQNHAHINNFINAKGTLNTKSETRQENNKKHNVIRRKKTLSSQNNHKNNSIKDNFHDKYILNTNGRLYPEVKNEVRNSLHKSVTKGNLESGLTDNLITDVTNINERYMQTPTVCGLSTAMLDNQDLSDYIQVEDVIEEVEITDEIMVGSEVDSSELASMELVQHNDITTALNGIPPDAFNDLFLEDKNESRWKETEELERAIEEVDKDVQSMTRSQGIDPTMLLEDIDSTSPVYSEYSSNFNNMPLPSFTMISSKFTKRDISN